MNQFFTKTLLIWGLCFIVNIAQGSNPVVGIKGVFLNIDYEIRVYDISPYIYPYLRNGKKFPELRKSDPSILCIRVNQQKEYPIFHGCLDQKFSEFLSHGISYEERRLQKTLDIRDFYAKNGHIIPNNYQVVLRKCVQTITDYDRKLKHPQNLGTVPCVVYADSFEMPDERCNLFDMFSSEVDAYLSGYGIYETICRLSKHHECVIENQVSLFATITTVVDGVPYAVPGFFQYTFNADNVCYHRAFKPWTKECLTSLSNGITQCVIRRAMRDLLIDLGRQNNRHGDCVIQWYDDLTKFFSTGSMYKESLNILQSASLCDKSIVWDYTTK